MPKKVQYGIEAVMCVLVLIFSYVMVRYGILRCLDQARMGRTTDALQIPAWIYSSFTPIGGFFLALHEIERIIDIIFEVKGSATEDKKEGAQK